MPGQTMPPLRALLALGASVPCALAFLPLPILTPTAPIRNTPSALATTAPWMTARRVTWPLHMSVIDREPDTTADLEADFKRLAKGGRLSLVSFMKTGEVLDMLEEKLLARSEIQGFWEEVAGSSDGTVDLDGYMKVHAKIDALFEEEEEEAGEDVAAAGDVDGEEAGEDEAGVDEEEEELPGRDEQVEGQDEPVIDLDADFEREAVDGRVTFEAFLRTGDLEELVDDGQLTEEELRELWDSVAKGKDTVDFYGFDKIWEAIESWFQETDDEEEDGDDEGDSEDDDDDVDGEAEEALEGGEADVEPPSTAGATSAVMGGSSASMEAPGGVKAELLRVVGLAPDSGVLEDNKAMDVRVSELIDNLIDAPENIAMDEELSIESLEEALGGEWDLIYSTSRTMRYNRGLCGLGASLPKAEFLGFSQKISIDGYSYDIVYTEKLRTLGRDLDVIVEGSWQLKDFTSIIDGEMKLVLDVLPAQIKYGFMTERLETGWKGVRVLNRCELTYLDSDLRIMKGQASEAYFVFRRRT